MTARFEEMPETHDGSTSFDFQLHFSEEISISYRAFKGGVFEITGGTVDGVRRMDPPSNVKWVITVSPSGDAEVEIMLPGNRECNVSGAVCTADSRKLSGSIEATVAGPAPPEVTGSGPFTVAEGGTTVGTLTATDEDTAAADLAWSITGGADSAKFAITSAGALAFAGAKDFESPDDADTDGSYEVTVHVSDGERSDTADVTVTLSNRNEAPTANAGEDQEGVEEGATVTLSGTGTDPDAGAKSSQTLDSPSPLVCATDEGPRSHSVVLTRDSLSSNGGATPYHISCGLPSVGALRVGSATLGRSSSSIARRSPLAFGVVYRSGSPASASVREGAMSANSEYASRLTGSSRAWRRPTRARSRT